MILLSMCSMSLLFDVAPLRSLNGDIDNDFAEAIKCLKQKNVVIVVAGGQTSVGIPDPEVCGLEFDYGQTVFARDNLVDAEIVLNGGPVLRDAVGRLDQSHLRVFDGVPMVNHYEPLVV
ncbi:hypothetical protein BDZ88DRAFT_69712 [Geranomyces variabilis]|nr:hypothetical protein BDZ88DRAFT_69712 [Geranomyces variabilis]